MKKKQYENPAMTVVKLQHTGMLLNQSDKSVPTKNRINDWDDGGTTDETIYM